MGLRGELVPQEFMKESFGVFCYYGALDHRFPPRHTKWLFYEIFGQEEARLSPIEACFLSRFHEYWLNLTPEERLFASTDPVSYQNTLDDL